MKKYIVLSLLFALSVLSYGAVTRQGGRQLWKEHQETVVKLTIDDSKIDAALTNFPVLVKLTSSNFNWAKSANDGRDVYFRDSNGGMLKYDRERHDKTNSVGEYWVKIPSVPDAASFFYMVYGDSSRTDEADRTNVWDSSFKMVQHMADSTTSRTADATSNGNFGTKKAANEPVEAAGKIGKGQTFDNTDDYITAPHLPLTTGATWSLWMKLTTVGHAQFFVGTYNASDNSYLIWNDGTYEEFYWYDSGNNLRLLQYSQATAGVWRCVAIVYNAGSALPYINGVPYGSPLSDVTGQIRTNTELTWMGKQAAFIPLNGLMDEVRISNTARSAAWIKAEYYTGVDSLLTFTKVR